jgi:hypothetical protein
MDAMMKPTTLQAGSSSSVEPAEHGSVDGA